VPCTLVTRSLLQSLLVACVLATSSPALASEMGVTSRGSISISVSVAVRVKAKFGPMEAKESAIGMQFGRSACISANNVTGRYSVAVAMVAGEGTGGYQALWRENTFTSAVALSDQPVGFRARAGREGCSSPNELSQLVVNVAEHPSSTAMPLTLLIAAE